MKKNIIKKNKKNKNFSKHNSKLGAIEMSMSTIVIIVISVIVLIFGIIFARNVMCSAIQINEEVNKNVKQQLISVFGADRFGVSCMGEGASEVSIATGGRRKVICMIKTQDNSAQYQLKIRDLKSLNPTNTPTSTVNKWILSEGWKGTVKPGQIIEADFLLLNIPKDAPSTAVQFYVDEINNGETVNSHKVTLDIVVAGFFKTTMC